MVLMLVGCFSSIFRWDVYGNLRALYRATPFCSTMTAFSSRLTALLSVTLGTHFWRLSKSVSTSQAMLGGADVWKTAFAM